MGVNRRLPYDLPPQIVIIAIGLPALACYNLSRHAKIICNPWQKASSERSRLDV